MTAGPAADLAVVIVNFNTGRVVGFQVDGAFSVTCAPSTDRDLRST